MIEQIGAIVISNLSILIIRTMKKDFFILLFIGGLPIFASLLMALIVTFETSKSIRPVYSIYHIWDNQIIQNDTISYLDSNYYIVDKENTQVLIHRIQ